MKCEVAKCEEKEARQRVFILDVEEQVSYLCRKHFTEFMKEARKAEKTGSRIWIKEWLQQLNVKEASK